MTTFLIVLFFGGTPLFLAAFILFGAIYRAKQHKKVYDAAEKFLNS